MDSESRVIYRMNCWINHLVMTNSYWVKSFTWNYDMQCFHQYCQMVSTATDGQWYKTATVQFLYKQVLDKKSQTKLRCAIHTPILSNGIHCTWRTLVHVKCAVPAKLSQLFHFHAGSLVRYVQEPSTIPCTNKELPYNLSSDSTSATSSYYQKITDFPIRFFSLSVRLWRL